MRTLEQVLTNQLTELKRLVAKQRKELSMYEAWLALDCPLEPDTLSEHVAFYDFEAKFTATSADTLVEIGKALPPGKLFRGSYGSVSFRSEPLEPDDLEVAPYVFDFDPACDAPYEFWWHHKGIKVSVAVAFPGVRPAQLVAEYDKKGKPKDYRFSHVFHSTGCRVIHWAGSSMRTIYWPDPDTDFEEVLEDLK